MRINIIDTQTAIQTQISSFIPKEAEELMSQITYTCAWDAEYAAHTRKSPVCIGKLESGEEDEYWCQNVRYVEEK